MTRYYPTGNERTLWLTTWERIDKFLPALKTELFPTPPQQTQIEPAVNASAGQEPDMMKKNIKSEQKNAGLFHFDFYLSGFFVDIITMIMKPWLCTNIQNCVNFLLKSILSFVGHD